MFFGVLFEYCFLFRYDSYLENRMRVCFGIAVTSGRRWVRSRTALFIKWGLELESTLCPYQTYSPN